MAPSLGKGAPVSSAYTADLGGPRDVSILCVSCGIERLYAGGLSCFVPVRRTVKALWKREMQSLPRDSRAPAGDGKKMRNPCKHGSLRPREAGGMGSLQCEIHPDLV